MSHPPDVSAWETWDSIFIKATVLGQRVIESSLASGLDITRIAFIPRGGLYVVNILSRMLGLSGDQVISLGVSKYLREDPARQGDFKIGQLPERTQVADQVVLLVDEVYDTGETAQWTRNMLLELGAAEVRLAVIHYKPGVNVASREPDFYIEAINGWIHYPWDPIDSLGNVYQVALHGNRVKGAGLA